MAEGSDSAVSDKKRMVYAFLQFLKDDKAEETIQVRQGLQSIYGIQEDDKALEIPTPLVDIMHAHLKAKGFYEHQDWVDFLDILKQRGYLNGLTEGTKEYDERIERAKQKFQARYAAEGGGMTADQLKEKGNESMKAGSHREAADLYTRAIEADAKNPVYYGNRAAAWTHLKEFSKAIDDCDRALTFDPQYAKAYSRKGTALFWLEKYQDAIDSYKKALEISPDDPGYQRDLKNAEDHLAKQSQPVGTGFPGMPGGFPGMPPGMDFGAIQGMMQNPQFQDMAMNMMKQPAMQDMMSNMMQGFAGGGGDGGNMMEQIGKMMQNPEQLQSMWQPNEDGSFNTPMGKLTKDQIEGFRNSDKFKDNPKLAEMQKDIQEQGFSAFTKHMNDPESMKALSDIASTVMQGAPGTGEGAPQAADGGPTVEEVEDTPEES